jgi:hypothetical protein
MIRKPRKRVVPGQSRKAKVVTLPAPTGGWNARDGLPMMAENDAVLLENWFPSTTSVDIRKGYVTHSSNLVGYIETLMAYSGESTNKLFAASSLGTIYDTSVETTTLGTETGDTITTESADLLLISPQPAVESVTGLTNGRFQYVNFSNSGGNYIIIANGADSVRAYNGTAWSTPSITGVTSADLIHVNAHKNRLWFVEVGTLSAWYLPTQSIAGAASEFDLKSYASKGGYLMAMATWTIDAGYGVDDLAVFITSNGQVLVYRGTDPSSASSWAIVGVWEIGSPIGRRCFMKWAGDLLIITRDGVVPMSGALQSSRTNPRVALTDKIQSQVGSDVQLYAGNFGWQLVFFPAGEFILLNIPVVTRSSQVQYVMNTITKAWAKFSGWDAGCWEIFEDELYFGGYQIIGKAWSGSDDNDAVIETSAVQAFSELGRPGIQKRVTMFGTVLYTNGSPSINGGVNVDYDTRENIASLQTQASIYGLWGTGTWDSAVWGPDLDIRKSWNAAAGVGNAFAPTLNTSTSGINVQWVNSTIIFEEGGFI